MCNQPPCCWVLHRQPPAWALPPVSSPQSCPTVPDAHPPTLLPCLPPCLQQRTSRTPPPAAGAAATQDGAAPGGAAVAPPPPDASGSLQIALFSLGNLCAHPECASALMGAGLDATVAALVGGPWGQDPVIRRYAARVSHKLRPHALPGVQQQQQQGGGVRQG